MKKIMAGFIGLVIVAGAYAYSSSQDSVKTFDSLSAAQWTSQSSTILLAGDGGGDGGGSGTGEGSPGPGGGDGDGGVGAGGDF